MRMKHAILVLCLGLFVFLSIPEGPGGVAVTFGEDEEYIAWAAIPSPDGKTLVTPTNGSTLLFWDVQTHKVRAVIRPQSGHRGVLALSPDVKLLALRGDNETVIKVWNVSTGEDLVAVQGHEIRTWGVTFSPDSKMLASRGADQKVRVWEIPSGKEIAAFAADCARDIAFSPDGTLLAACCFSEVNKIKIWNIADKKELAAFGDSIRDCECLTFSPDGKTLAVTDAFGGSTVGVRGHEHMGVRLFDVATGHERLRECPSVSGDFPRDYDDSPKMYLAFSLDGKTVACGNQWTVGLWDVKSGKNTASFGLGGTRRVFPRSCGFLARLRAEDCPEIMFVTFTPEGKLMAFGYAPAPEQFPPSGKIVMWLVTSVPRNE